MDIPIYKRDETKDYLLVLKAIKSLPFNVGKNTLSDFLTGDYKNKSIKKNSLDSYLLFGSLNKNKKQVIELIDTLINNNFIEIISKEGKRFLKLLSLTKKGLNEINDPKFLKRKTDLTKFDHKTNITENDKKMFDELSPFLSKYNECQKKAIISNTKKILCIAGAGSGKTTVLTKRIEFLVKYKGVNPSKILAITFTRKAKSEMKNRLNKLNIVTNIETFNSFSEKILRKYQDKIYSRHMKVITYPDKIMSIMQGLDSIGLKIDDAIDIYFTNHQKINKSNDELMNLFLNDCYFILDYYKSKNIELTDFSLDTDDKYKKSARMIFQVCKYLENYMNNLGLRDYTDQILDTIKFFKNNNQHIPEFEHLLVDEYQDVNSMQVDLIDTINPKNLFCVGDPRQSIYGWRGSDIKFILNFEEKHQGSELIYLNINYRSNKKIVDFINQGIKHMNLPDLISNKKETTNEKTIRHFYFPNEIDELNFICEAIKKSKFPKNEIFILARTNRQLKALSGLLKNNNIKFVLKTDDSINGNAFILNHDQVLLATVHSIKGLEASQVYLIGANSQNFPIKASDHPVIEIIKVEEYDKDDEEKRLFYVAISRAKESLIITSTNSTTSYLTDDMQDMIE